MDACVCVCTSENIDVPIEIVSFDFDSIQNFKYVCNAFSSAKEEWKNQLLEFNLKANRINIVDTVLVHPFEIRVVQKSSKTYSMNMSMKWTQNNKRKK